MLNDNYDLTASVAGYDNLAIDPATVDIIAGTDIATDVNGDAVFPFVPIATGTLTFSL